MRGRILAEEQDNVETSLTIPTGLGWDTAAYPATFGLIKSRDRYIGTCSDTAAQLFDRFSTARSAPGTTLYVDVAVADGGNNGLSWATAYNKIYEAVTAANTAGLPATIFVKTGSYSRSRTPSNGNALWPTVDVALIAVGGRVTTGTWDQYTTPSLDGTYTLCYALTVATVDRVVDLRSHDEHGLYPDLLRVASAALANATPNSYYHSGSVVYIRRGDGLAVTNANTRVYRGGSGVLRCHGNLYSMMLAGADASSGWDIEGSDGYAAFSVLNNGTSYSTKKAVVADNCTFRYGGTSASLRNGVGINGIHGIAAFFNCSADSNASDGFNCHQNWTTLGGPQTAFLTINCSSKANGKTEFGLTSCNGYTLHEDVKGIDIGGDHGWAHGGAVRNINSSKGWMAGSIIGPDFGDVRTGGIIRSECVRADNTAQIWLDTVSFRVSAGSTIAMATSGTAIRYKTIATSMGVLASTGSGVVEAY